MNYTKKFDMAIYDRIPDQYAKGSCYDSGFIQSLENWRKSGNTEKILENLEKIWKIKENICKKSGCCGLTSGEKTSLISTKIVLQRKL